MQLVPVRPGHEALTFGADDVMNGSRYWLAISRFPAVYRTPIIVIIHTVTTIHIVNPRRRIPSIAEQIQILLIMFVWNFTVTRAKHCPVPIIASFRKTTGGGRRDTFWKSMYIESNIWTTPTDPLRKWKWLSVQANIRFLETVFFRAFQSLTPTFWPSLYCH